MYIYECLKNASSINTAMIFIHVSIDFIGRRGRE